jgi:hypothetical protein
MIINWIGILGLTYLIFGLANYQNKRVDRLYTKIWGEEPPNRREFVSLGLGLIICWFLLIVMMRWILVDY